MYQALEQQCLPRKAKENRRPLSSRNWIGNHEDCNNMRSITRFWVTTQGNTNAKNCVVPLVTLVYVTWKRGEIWLDDHTRILNIRVNVISYLNEVSNKLSLSFSYKLSMGRKYNEEKQSKILPQAPYGILDS